MARKKRARRIEPEIELIEENSNEKPKDKSMLTFFFIMIPSLLIAMTSAITDLFIRVMFQGVLLLLQIVLVKNFIDSYYGK